MVGFRLKIALSLLLALVTVLLYLKVAGYPFIVLDDRSYVLTNTHVQKGLTWESIKWAFTSTSRSNWFPLTWMSHMLDVSLYGTAPGPHHISNLIIHTLSTVLLFLALAGMTASTWRSFLVAMLFGIHPLHVESVAWVAERKDVLSGFFFMLILICYAHYSITGQWKRYGLVVLTCALGLMSKPMLVSVPIILLLVDMWPLGRLGVSAPDTTTAPVPAGWSRVILDKLPLALLAVAVSAITVIAQRRTISSLNALPIIDRLENALVSYCSYLGKTFWPSSLAIYYPYPADIALWKSAGAAVLLIAITIVSLMQIKKRPYLGVGWFWFLIMLVPVIGLVQVGRQAMADRYMYLPAIGIFIMVAWSLPDWERLVHWQKTAMAVTIVAVMTTLGAVTYNQVSYWQNGITLFEHSLEATGNNYQGRKGLAIELSQAGRNQEAIIQYFAALRLYYDDAETHRNLAFAFEEIGKIEHTIFHLREAFRIDPSDSMAYFALQHYLMQRDRK